MIPKTSAAPANRNCASARAPNPRNASLPATMFDAQQIVAPNIRRCIRPWLRAAATAWGPGGNLPSARTGLFKRLLAFRGFLYALEVGGKTKSRRLRHTNSALRAHRDFRVDDVFAPIAAAGGNVSRQSESGERRHGNIVRAPDARFEHAAAPNRHSVGTANVMDGASSRVAAHPAQLDIDNLTGADFNGLARVVRAVDGFVKANRRCQLTLKLGVVQQIFPSQRLLDHHQEKPVE